MRSSHFRIILFLLTIPAWISCSSKEKSPETSASIAVSVPYEVDSFDPHATITISNFAVLSNFYEPLVRTDLELKVQPCLAKSWQNPDSQTWVFQLEPTARFHSGRHLTSEDVEYSLNRLIHDPQMRMRGFLPEISEVKAISQSEVRIKTTRPLTVFLNKLNFALIIPKGSTPQTLAQNIDGTGPYRMNGWSKGSFIRLLRNEEYWGTAPAIHDAILWLKRSPDEAIQDLARGKSQMVQSNTKKLEQVAHSMAGIDVFTHNSLFVKLLGFDVARVETPYCNVKPNPFRNPLVRQAIHLAIDRNNLISRLSTSAVPATQPVPAFIFGFNPALPHPVFDLIRARSLMNQAGYGAGFQVMLHTRNLLRETAAIVRDQLKQIGIEVEVNATSDEDFFPTVNRHGTTFYLTRWGCPSGDASDILDDVFHTDDSRIFGGNNFSHFSDPEVDRDIEDAAGTQSVEERQVLIQHIMDLLMQRLPMIPLFTDVDTYAIDHRFAWEPRNDSYILVSEIRVRKE